MIFRAQQSQYFLLKQQSQLFDIKSQKYLNLKNTMLQRQHHISYQRYSFQQKLQKSQQQLSPDFYQLDQLKQEIKRNKITQLQCANILQQMIQKISHPIIGIQLMRDKFLEMDFYNNTGFKSFQAIQSKAQAIYIESIISDIKKIQNNQEFQPISQQDVKTMIQEINWKIGMQKSIHEPQIHQSGDHVDLMKFFQGLRNYQNWHQNIQKQTIQHLKHKAHQIQINLTLKKGFIISKLQKIKESYQKSHQKQFISKCARNNKLYAIGKVSKSIQLNYCRDSFNNILNLSRQQKDSEKVGKMLSAYWQNKLCSKIAKEMSLLTRRILKIRLFVKRIQKIQNTKKAALYSKFLEKLNFKKNIKTSNVTLASEIILSLIQRKQKVWTLKKMNISTCLLMFRSSKLILKNVNYAFKQIRSQAEANAPKGPELSLKAKGKILNALRAYQQKPIDIRQTFYNWYIKGNQQKFSKQIYNIWMTGGTNKFTFFMRLKNLIDQNRRYKIKYELKLFLMVMNQKLNKYYKHGQKTIFQKWVQNNRRIRKIQDSFKTLHIVENQNNEVLKKHGFEKILNAYKKNVLLQKFCSRYLNTFINNIKVSVDTWKIMPDVKRSKGQIIMRKTLRRIVQAIVNNKEQSFKIFRANKIQGRDKKVRLLRKAFNQDFIYLQRYFQTWRTNKNNLIKAQQNFQIRKQKTILLLAKYQKTLYKKNIKDIINKFRVRAQKDKKKQKQTKRIFINLLATNRQNNMLQIFIIFKNNWKEGNQKKNNLVKWFVNENKKNQQIIFCSIKNHSQQNFNMQKIRRTQEMFALAQNRFKQMFSIFDKSTFVYNFLNKMLKNRTENIQIALNCIKAMPKRMNWKKRSNGIKLYETLKYLLNKNKGLTLNKYKQSLLVGRFKMTKSMDIMAAKYFDVTRRYFNEYRKNVNRIKFDQTNKILGMSFQNMNEIVINNFKTLFIGQAEWKKKSDHLTKLNQRIKGRVGQAFKLWRQTSKAMEYFKKIQNQKKSRYIEILMKALAKNQVQETKKAIHMFEKNAKVTDVQLAFLKRLCDTQAGKVVKAVMIWKNLPEPKNREKIAKATKFESLMARIGFKNFRKSFLAFKDGHYFGNQKKKYCIRQLVAKSSSGLKSYFQKWRGNSKLSIIFNKCQTVSHLIHICQNIKEVNFKLIFEGNEAKQKKKRLDKLDGILCQHKRQLIYLWRQKMTNIRDHQNKKRRLISNLAQIQQSTQNKNVRDYAIKKFTQFRLYKRLQRQKIKEAVVLQIVDKANRRRKENISQSLDAFKFTHIKGNFKKKRAFENWLKDKIGHIHNILDGWNTLTKQKILQQKRRFISNNFESMDIVVKSNFVHLLSSSKQLQLKKKMLNNLFRAQQLKLKGYLLLWKNHAKQLKILNELDKQAKTSILQRINKIVSIGSEQTIKKTIMKFRQSMKIQMVQKKFINQLLKTKSGLALDAFNRWKSIPAINLGEKYKKAQKFYYKLQVMYKSHLGFIHKTFKQQQQDGNLMKKQSILQLFDMTSTGIRRYYRRWQKMAKQRHILNSVSSLMKSLDIMNQAITNQYLIIFQDQRAYTIKVNAINKLIAAANGTTQNYFNKWRDAVKQLRIQQSMDSQKKTLALAMFTKAIQGSQKGQTVSAIQKFQKNMIVTQISKKFFNRLLQTKTGKLVQLFEKLKTIPDTKVAVKKKKAIKFEGSLNRFAMKVIRTTYNSFKTCNFIAIDRKKYCINKLVRISMGEQMKKFLKWRNVTRQDKILSHSGLTDKSFGNMEKVFSNSLQLLFRGHKEQIQKKKGLCRKLVMNSHFVQQHAFMIWKQAIQKDDIKNIKHESKVRDILKNMINIHNNHQKKTAVGSFGIFKNILSVKRLQTHSQKQKNLHNKAYLFVDKLQKFKKLRKQSFIHACKNSSVEMNFTNKIKNLELLFKNTTEVYSQNLMMLYRNQRESVIIENALNRIFTNFKVGTEKAFSIWRQQAKVLKLQQSMGNQKKKGILDILNKFLNNSQANQVKNAIEKFNTNFRQTKIQKEILMKILNCKAGKVPILFMQWKALPSQTGKKYKMRAMKFENALFRAYTKRMKFVYQGFKTQSYDAVVKKQFAIKKLIQVTQSDSNRVFNKWRKVNNQAKITQKISVLDRIFSFSQNMLVNNIQIFNEFKKQHNAKVNALEKIFIIKQIQLKTSLNQWKEQNKVYKIDRLTNAITKYSQPQLQKRFLKQSFTTLKQKYQMQTMKGYINSLWKWKMSNTQANYYEKFIKIFRQSQQLLILSKLLNKKQSDTLHSAFYRIKQASLLRHNRKAELVEKYFTKKVRTYFSLMRKNAFKDQVQTWKNKYTQTVRVQQFTGILGKIVRKYQNESFLTLNLNSKYIEKLLKFISILQKYKNNNLNTSMKNIYRFGFYKILKQAFDVRNKVKNYLTLQSINQINSFGRMRQFYANIQHVMTCTSIRKTFYRLRKNSERRAKQKLALLLLEERLGRKQMESRLKALNAFKKRRIQGQSLDKLAQIINSKIQERQRYLFSIDQNDLKIVKLLQRFKKGTAIKNILQKQDKKILHTYFNRLKKKQNIWISQSIKRFATRSSIRSSLAISLWRLKTYAQN